VSFEGVAVGVESAISGLFSLLQLFRRQIMGAASTMVLSKYQISCK